jgi:hypothetical protein
LNAVTHCGVVFAGQGCICCCGGLFPFMRKDLTQQLAAVPLNPNCHAGFTMS